MYGKSFASMYEGSMYGAGINVFAVWGYCIAKAEHDTHTIDLNPALLSHVLGADQADVTAAIEFLCSPDNNSRCKENDGARLVNVSGFTYFITTHQQYAKIKNSFDRKEYMREYMREYREKCESVKQKSLQEFTKANPTSTSTSTSTSKKGDARGKKIKTAASPTKDFELFWDAYPRKVGKGAAHKAWEAAKDRPNINSLIDIINKNEATEQWKSDGGKFIPHPSTWLNQKRWDDEIFDTSTTNISEKARKLL